MAMVQSERAVATADEEDDFGPMLLNKLEVSISDNQAMKAVYSNCITIYYFTD